MPRLLLFIVCLFSAVICFAGEERRVEVTDPYLEMHTGPGRGYPIFYVVEQGEFIVLEKRRTDWFYVRTSKNVKGWVTRKQMLRTLEITGEPIAIRDPSSEEFFARHWELGALYGDFGGANALTVLGGYSFTRNLGVEVSLSQALGSVANNEFISVQIMHQPFPEWRIAPYFALGGGFIQTRPKASLVQNEDRQDELLLVGSGLRAYLSRRFVFRFDYKNYVILTNRDDNQGVDEWKLGFTAFF